MSHWRFGEITIDRVLEIERPTLALVTLYPASEPDALEPQHAWLVPRVLDPATGMLTMAFHTFVIRTRRRTILVDTCVGHDKSRPQRLFWHMKKFDTFLPRLAAAGVRPEDVDYVMCTHLHSDHVGWNTQLRDGRWVPTFPNAKYIFARSEWEGFEALHRKHPQPQFLDSVLPIMEARQAELVSGDFALDDEVWLEPTPGHTQGHVCVHLASQGSEAIITGDCIHSPVQCVEPEWIMRADFDPTLARTTRRSFLERYCDSNVMVCATHFPEPSTGRIIQRDKAFWFEYEGIEG